MKIAVFQLESLTCPSCIKKIETTLDKTSGVNSSKVLFSLGKVRTVFIESQIEIAAVSDIISKLGYEIISSKVSSVENQNT